MNDHSFQTRVGRWKKPAEMKSNFDEAWKSFLAQGWNKYGIVVIWSNYSVLLCIVLRSYMLWW